MKKLVTLTVLLWLAATLSAVVSASDAGVVETTANSVEDKAPMPAGSATWSYPEALLYDNGPLVTHPGGGYGGADASAVQTALEMANYGWGNQVVYDNRIADDFEVPGPQGWTIDQVTFFGYQSGSPAEPSTFTALNLAIWDGEPGAGGSIVWGDHETNCMVSSEWSGSYRVRDTYLLSSQRPIMASVCATGGLLLPPGQYWLDWQADGSLTSGPYAPPISILGETTTGNGLQSIDGGLTWSPTLDGGTQTPQGFPFLIEGSAGDPPNVFVQKIDLRLFERQPGVFVVRGLVRIMDEGLAPVNGAVVVASWQAPGGNLPPQVRTTRPNGIASFGLRADAPGTYTLCVDDVTLSGYEYDPGMNWESCDSVEVP